MTEQSDKPSVDGLIDDLEYAVLARCQGHGSSTRIKECRAALLAALAGPLEQPQEPQSNKANLAQASGGEDLLSARPEAHDVATCPYFSMYLDLSEASGYPHEKDTMVSPEEYGAALLKDAMRYRWLRKVALRFDGRRRGVEVYEFVAPIAYGPNIDAAIDSAIAACEASAGSARSDKPAASSAPESSLSVPKEQQ